MATERQLQFRIGLLVMIALGIGGWLVYEFGDLKQFTQKRYQLTLHFDSASGLYPTAPVTFSGLTVGTVKQIQLDDSDYSSDQDEPDFTATEYEIEDEDGEA